MQETNVPREAILQQGLYEYILIVKEKHVEGRRDCTPCTGKQRETDWKGRRLTGGPWTYIALLLTARVESPGVLCRRLRSVVVAAMVGDGERRSPDRRGADSRTRL